MKNQVLSDNQTQTKEQRMLAKANFLVKNRKVRRSPCIESRNVWMVGSYSKPKAWYVVRFHDDMDAFECGCEAYKYSKDNCCLHLIAVAIFEGGGPL